MNRFKSKELGMHTRRVQRGAVFIEAILIIPFLILVVGATIEFARAIRHKRIVASLSKEAANLIFRECADFKTLVTTPCLPMKQNSMQVFAQDIIPDTTISVTVGVRDDDGNSFVVTEPPEGTPCLTASGGNRVETLLNGSFDVAVCARARIPFRPIVPFLGAFLGRALDISSFTDESII